MDLIISQKSMLIQQSSIPNYNNIINNNVPIVLILCYTQR